MKAAGQYQTDSTRLLQRQGPSKHSRCAAITKVKNILEQGCRCLFLNSKWSIAGLHAVPDTFLPSALLLPSSWGIPVTILSGAEGARLRATQEFYGGCRKLLVSFGIKAENSPFAKIVASIGAFNPLTALGSFSKDSVRLMHAENAEIHSVSLKKARGLS